MGRIIDAILLALAEVMSTAQGASGIAIIPKMREMESDSLRSLGLGGM